MSWEHVVNLLSRVGGDIERADPAELKAATADGPGDAETQIRIAKHYYKASPGKEKNEQTLWEH